MKILDLEKMTTSVRLGSLMLAKDEAPIGQIKGDLTFWGNDRDGNPILLAKGYTETKSHLIIPREYRVPGVTPVDLCGPGEDFNRWEDKVTSFLDDMQEEAWNAFADAPCGVLSIPGGRGKTVLACKKMVRRGKATLVVIPSLSIMQGWVREVKMHTGISDDDLGVFSESRYDQLDRPVVIASLKSLSTKASVYTAELRDRFGTIIFDEAHHMGAPTHLPVASMFRGARFGLTATPDRGDGTTALYLHHLGPIIYTSNYHPLTPTIRFAKAPADVTEKDRRVVDRGGRFNHGLLWGVLGEEKKFNANIRDWVEKFLAEGRTPMVFTNSREHAHRLHDSFEKDLKPTGIITGKVNWDQREEELLTNDLIVGTMGAAREGLNRLQLDTVLITMPVGRQAQGRFLQSIWRALRDAKQRGLEKMDPLVVVMVPDIGTCYAMAKMMRNTAVEQGYTVEGTEGGVGRVREVSTSHRSADGRIRGGKRFTSGSVRRGGPR